MPQAGTSMAIAVQAMGLTGTIVGAGVQALEVDGVMAPARAGHLMDSGGVMDLGLVPGLDQAPGTVMGLEVMVLMVEAMGLEVDKAILVAAATVEEAAVQAEAATATPGRQVTGTTMAKTKAGVLARTVWLVCSYKRHGVKVRYIV